MNPNSAIKKYYVGFALLMFLLLGVLVYTFGQAGAAKTDRETNKAVEKISAKLGAGTSVPDSLSSAGLKDLPETIKYTRLDASQYKICINYKQSSGIFDAGWASLFGGYFAGGSTDINSNSNYFDSYVEYKHKKGENCQTVKPYTYDSSYYSGSSSKTNSGVYTYCDTYSNTYMGRRTAKIKSVDTLNRTIYFDDSYTQNYQDGSGFQYTTNIPSITYNANTTFYDNSCQKTQASSLVAGEKADFYVSSQSDIFAGQVEVLSGASVISQ